METPIPVDLGRIAQDLQIRRVQVESVVQLLDEGDTVPFIARYRKDKTGGLGEGLIREVQSRLARVRELNERKRTILQTVEAQGRMTEELGNALRAADSPKRVEDLYLPYKSKKKSKGTEAREQGLEPLALRIWNRDETLTDLPGAAAEFVNAEKGLDSVEKVTAGVSHILAESISELAHVRDAIRRMHWKLGKIVTSRNESLPEGKGQDYRDYFAYSEPVGHIPAHRVLAINRGEKEGTLKVKLEAPRAELERTILGLLPLDDHPHRAFFTASTIDALDRLLLPALEREIKRDLTEAAERHAVDVFARNLRSLLLQPPLHDKVVLAIDPGRKGCQVVVLDQSGALLEHVQIQPFPPQNRRHEAKQTIKDLVARHKIQIVAIGNGTACREMEELIAEIIAEGTHFLNNPGVPFPVPPRKEKSSGRSSSGNKGEPTAPAASPTGPSDSESPATGASDTPAVAVAATPEPTAGVEPSTQEEAAAPQQPVNGDGTHGEAEQAAQTVSNPDEAPPQIAGGSTDSDEPAAAQPEAEASPTPEAADPPAAPAGEPEISLPGAEIVEMSAETATSEAAVDPTAPAPAPAPDEATSEAAAATASTPGASFATPLTQPPKGTVKPASGSKPEREREREREARPPKQKTPPPPPSAHPADPLLAELSYIIVNEAGANVYSTSALGKEELPDVEPETRGTVSIGRRLLNPLTELVKVEPQSVGVGQYQHDVQPAQLKDSLKHVVESCVNLVGVELNSASSTLLAYVSGLNELLARRITEHRKEKGAFRSREALKEVEGITEKVFQQAAGFLRVSESENPLDRTWVHPDSYGLAQKALEALGEAPNCLTTPEGVEALRAKLNAADSPELARTLEISEPALHDLFTALAQVDRDPRHELPRPIFKRGLLKLEDLENGAELKGTVLNVVDFGAFVDIGLKDSGLVHISQLANRYIKSPHDVVSVGDVVTTWVMNVDKERKRVSLTMIQPGTERSRAANERPERGPRRGAGGGGGASGGRGRGPGGPDRPQSRGPRPEGPAADRRDSGGEARSAEAQAPRPGTNRIPGPPSRMLQGGRPGGRGQGGRGGFGGRGPGGRSGGPNREAQAERPGADTPAPPRKPKPAPSQEPLSKDAIAGAAPLRTFGQLKQFFDLRTKDDEPQAQTAPAPENAALPQAPAEPAQHETSSGESPPNA